MSGAVLYDGWCGEPIAWSRVGEPVIGHEWTAHGQVAVTERLTPAVAAQKYGPVTEVRVGRQGGFQSVTYGATKFVCRYLDPRGTGLHDDSVVVVNDHIKDDHECPACKAAPGDQCLDDKARPRSSHRKRREGRTRWEIETAEAEAHAALEKTEAAEQWQRDMATPPTPGTAIEVKQRKWIDGPSEYGWVPDGSDSFTVERTYANRTVLGVAQTGTLTYFARNEQSGDWQAPHLRQAHLSASPCRTGLPYRTTHKAGLTVHDDRPWI